MRYRPTKAEAIDLDTLNHLKLFKVVFNARALGKTGVKVMLSPSGKGYHIYCNEGFTLEEARMLGDCKGRLAYWENQGYTLTFNFRHNRWGDVVGKEEPYDPFRLPFWRVRWRKWRKSTN